MLASTEGKREQETRNMRSTKNMGQKKAPYTYIYIKKKRAMNPRPISFPSFPSRALPLTTIIKVLGILHREPVFMQCAKFLHVLRQQGTMQERLLGRPIVLTNRSSLRFVETSCAGIDSGSAHGSRPLLPPPPHRYGVILIIPGIVIHSGLLYYSRRVVSECIHSEKNEYLKKTRTRNPTTS